MYIVKGFILSKASEVEHYSLEMTLMNPSRAFLYNFIFFDPSWLARCYEILHNIIAYVLLHQHGTHNNSSAFLISLFSFSWLEDLNLDQDLVNHPHWHFHFLYINLDPLVLLLCDVIYFQLNMVRQGIVGDIGTCLV